MSSNLINALIIKEKHRDRYPQRDNAKFQSKVFPQSLICLEGDGVLGCYTHQWIDSWMSSAAECADKK